MNTRKSSSNPAITHRVESAISDCRSLRDKYLDLQHASLTTLPADIFDLEHVEVINLTNNNLRHLSPSLLRLPNLRDVNLLGNPVETLPDGLRATLDAPAYIRCRDQIDTNVVRLVIEEETENDAIHFLTNELRTSHSPRSITIGHWAITIGDKRLAPTPSLLELIMSIGDFKHLESLSLRGTMISSVPPGIRKLKNLKHLNLDGLRLSNLPGWIGELKLESFSAADNRLRTLPGTFRELRRLKILDVDWNPLISIPQSVFGINSLESLLVRDCQIRAIPAEILRLTRLKKLNCDDNPIDSPPEEVTKKGLDAIRDYWRQRTETGVDYLCEAKLIILGEAGAGKSSLAQKIKNPNYQLRKDEKSTEGIDVICYDFPTAIHTKEGKSDKIVQRQFQTNIWDFGGQEIYHATHQFFLTRRSVYVLVCDDRKEDTDFSYWLHVVEMLSDGSPLIIVQNEKQDRTRDINLSSLRARFSNLRHAVSLNLEGNRGLENAIKLIRSELESLPHVGAALPATWKRVREALEKDSRDHVSLDEFLKICAKHGFTRRDDKLQLSGYLHDLGICLHFQDDPLLKNIVILKPGVLPQTCSMWYESPTARFGRKDFR